MNKSDSIKSFRDQGYKLKYIPKDSENLKACTRPWKNTPTDETIPDDCNYVVIQEDNKIVLDIDDPAFNFILDDYLDKTLVVQSGGGGRHGYFKDIPRAKPVKSCPLFCNDKRIGDIKAGLSNVVGPGSIHQNGNHYAVISKTEQILDIDFEEILSKLKHHNINTNQNSTSREFESGLIVGERNSESFKTACNLFEYQKLDFDSGLNFLRTWNNMSKHPLSGTEIRTIAKSAWNRIQNKANFNGADKIDNVALELQKKHKFLTLRSTDEILLFNGKIYDRLQAETIIKEETEKLIPNCTTHHRREVINKIKSQTFTDLEKFDDDSNLITVNNGILNLTTLELQSHSSDHLSRVLLPVNYIPPKHDVNPETIFEDIEKNLENTLFWKSLKSSFTVDGKSRKDDFETVLEIIASVILKRHVDERAFIFLGQGENGKSVFLDYVELILGKNNVSKITLQDIADDKFMRSNLSGMSANIFSDLEQNELRHTGKIKSITSNEGIEVQKKHQQGFTLYPFCKLLFSCNRFPKVYDQSQGFFRRWIIVKWERNFENDSERIPYLRVKLAENTGEIDFVFSCLVFLARKLNKSGKFSHSKDWKTIQREWNENADPIDDFVSNCIVDSEHHKSKREVYQFYKKYVLDKGETPLGMGQFSKNFSEYCDEDRIEFNGRTQRVWLNVDFKITIQTKLNTNDTT